MPNEQTWDPERYKRNARFVTEMGTPVVDLLDPKEGEWILDLGCGDGVLTEQIAAMGCNVVGVDGSEAFVKTAKEHGLTAYVMDRQALTFEEWKGTPFCAGLCPIKYDAQNLFGMICQHGVDFLTRFGF
ncbi:MAG: methyltransferase domain-containing protein [bacterium]|nr:methyltransferase domain-containing protein [bacterium]